MKISILPRCRAEAIAVSAGQTRGVYPAPTAAAGAKRSFGEPTITLEAKAWVDIVVVPEGEGAGLSA
jgi:hypothetical protein